MDDGAKAKEEVNDEMDNARRDMDAKAGNVSMGGGRECRGVQHRWGQGLDMARLNN